jgi:radical SAM protein with 4Fe4S-binding SPASM domain
MSPCRDYHDYIVGNVKEHTVQELWNSERYRAFRASMARDGLLPACTRCCGLMGY